MSYPYEMFLLKKHNFRVIVYDFKDLWLNTIVSNTKRHGVTWISRVPCFWKKLRPKWTKIHSSINFWPNIKSDIRFFFLHNVNYGTAKKNAKFYYFGMFLGPKSLKNDEKWLNFAYHFSDDPEWWACCDFSYQIWIFCTCKS